MKLINLSKRSRTIETWYFVSKIVLERNIWKHRHKVKAPQKPSKLNVEFENRDKLMTIHRSFT